MNGYECVRQSEREQAKERREEGDRGSELVMHVNFVD